MVLALNFELPQVLTAAEERKVMIDLKSDNNIIVEDAVNKLVEHNLRLALKVANKYSKPDGVELDDLFSIAITGLIHAAKSFNMDKCNRFSTYAYPCIENSIRMYLRKNKKSFLDISCNAVRAQDEDGNEETILSTLTDGFDIHGNVEDKMMLQTIIEKIELLPEQDRTILKLRYGLVDGRLYKQHEISKITGFSQPMISRLIRRSLHEIRMSIQVD